MDKSPNKEMIAFFTEVIGIGGILFLIVGTVLIKLLEVIGIVKITI
jgi:hypothetical protein